MVNGAMWIGNIRISTIRGGFPCSQYSVATSGAARRMNLFTEGWVAASSCHRSSIAGRPASVLPVYPPTRVSKKCSTALPLSIVWALEFMGFITYWCFLGPRSFEVRICSNKQGIIAIFISILAWQRPSIQSEAAP